MPSLRALIGVLVLSATVLALAGVPARADEDRATFVWAPYLVIGATTIEITDAADHATWPIVTVYLRSNDGGASCSAGLCTYRFEGPRIEAGGSWVFDPYDYTCSRGLPTGVCLPDGAEGAASFEPAIGTGIGANPGATTPDPDGLLTASVTAPAGIYDAVPAMTEITLTDVARRATDVGTTTAIRVVGAAGLRVDWYLDDQLLVEQQIGVGSYCCGEAGYVQTDTATIDPRDVAGLDDDAHYTVVITRTWGGYFAVIPAETIDDR